MVKDFATRTNVTILVLLAPVGLLGLRGGFEEADPEGFQFFALPAGAASSAQPVELSVAPFDIEVRGTYMVEDARVVEVRLTNTGSRPVHRPENAFSLEDSAKPADGQVKFVKWVSRITPSQRGDGVPLFQAINPNPGVPLDLAIVFTAPPEEEDGTRRLEEADTLVITSLEYRRSFLDNSMTWLPGERMAEVELQ